MYRSVVALLGVAVLTTAAGVSAALGASGQSPNPTEPIVVVESFLLVVTRRIPGGATALVAPVTALHDADGEWFIDAATMSDWLRQLTGKYLIETMSPPLGRRVCYVDRAAHTAEYSFSGGARLEHHARRPRGRPGWQDHGIGGPVSPLRVPEPWRAGLRVLH